jgi:hypothetical protein
MLIYSEREKVKLAVEQREILEAGLNEISPEIADCDKKRRIVEQVCGQMEEGGGCGPFRNAEGAKEVYGDFSTRLGNVVSVASVQILGNALPTGFCTGVSKKLNGNEHNHYNAASNRRSREKQRKEVKDRAVCVKMRGELETMRGEKKKKKKKKKKREKPKR